MPKPQLTGDRSHTLRVVIGFAILYVVWGTTYLAIRVGVSDAHLPPALFAAMRGVPAGIMLLLFAKATGRSLRMTRRDLVTTVMVGCFLLIGGQYGTFLAEVNLPSGLAALIVALLPLWIAVAESLLPDMDRPTWRGYLGLLLGFLGLVLLLAPRITGIAGTPAELIGAGMQVLATWLWTTGSVISKRRPVHADSIVVTGVQMLSSGLVLLALGTGLGEWERLHWTPAGAGALVYLIVLGSCIAYPTFVWLLANVPASKVMTYAYVNPVVAVFLGWLVLSERVDGWVIGGMVVIVSGVALATTAPTRPPRRLHRTSIGDSSEVRTPEE